MLRPMGALDRLRSKRDDIAARSRALVVRQNEYGYDPFGLSRDHVKNAARVMRWIYRYYFRAQAYGIENIPPAGRVLFIANHSGQLPFDGLVIGAATFLEPTQPRLVRSMVEYFVPTVPFMSYLFSRFGQVTGTPENCRRLLAEDEAILVFPEGARGISKPFSKRYQLADFGLGFMRLALETRTPIVPVGIVGGEEQSPAIANLPGVGRLFGSPAFPVTLTFPWLGLASFLPLPVKFRLHFGRPIHFEGDADEEDAAVEAKVEVVKEAIRALVADGLAARTTWFS